MGVSSFVGQDSELSDSEKSAGVTRSVSKCENIIC